jgi:hypothetical protein
MTKNINLKHRSTNEYTNYLVSNIGILNFLFIWNLVLVYWYFALN